MTSNLLTQYLPRILTVFPSLADIEDREWSREGIRVVEMEPDYTIEEGKVLEYAFLILEGTIRMYKISAGGREITLYRIQGGECCPLMSSSILGEYEYEATACVETTGVALMIPVNIFRDWMDRYREFRQFIFQSFASRILILSNLLDSINFKSIRGRISEYLNRMAAKAGHSGPLQITHDQLSVELGTAREVVSRTLKGLEKEGIIRLSRGNITINNVGALKTYAE